MGLTQSQGAIGEGRGGRLPWGQTPGHTGHDPCPCRAGAVMTSQSGQIPHQALKAALRNVEFSQ